MNLANLKRILPIYLICLLLDIFVHFHNALLNLLIYSTKDSNIHLVENEEKTRLNRLMKWDILKKYFYGYDE